MVVTPDSPAVLPSLASPSASLSGGSGYEWVGAAWLVQQFGLRLGQPLFLKSALGGRRERRAEGEGVLQFHPRAMRPPPTLRGQLAFHLKHEPAHLEFLSRLFAACGPEPLAEWVSAEPTGRFSRRAAFLYEWMTGSVLPRPAAVGGPYVDALEGEHVVVASPERAAAVPRWRVRDNLPGTPAWCPLLPKTEAVERAAALDIQGLLAELRDEFGTALLLRSAAGMGMRESRASFAIEGEGGATDRITRFADVLARRIGGPVHPLQEDELQRLQSDILGPRHSLERLGLRSSPVFVGEVVRFQEVVHYIAPPVAQLGPMLAGLRAFLERTEGQSPVVRSAAASFGFVFVHPLADGNGRVHRFLLNDLLRRDGAVPAPLLLPLSATIHRDAAERRSYDGILEDYSRPLMASIDSRFRFAANRTRYPDGVNSNFECLADDDSLPVWRFPVMGSQVAYLAGVIERTVRDEMRTETRELLRHTRARAAVKSIVEMPDGEVDRVIRSALANEGALTRLMARELPTLQEPGVWEAVAAAVLRAFAE